MYMCVYMCIYMCMYVCMFLCMYVCMYVCMFVCLFVCCPPFGCLLVAGMLCTSVIMRAIPAVVSSISRVTHAGQVNCEKSD